ncbi:hypothetical protein PR202_gb26791 [Eleusine coracana subsp. coracana]|uniref:F-box domain-containing protein n=1 Tax=Eleusine coracana subsp. coracana TaxID=191504 RepID=A0AAV5FS65_ELECO|nr:hypothetical protein QOZ80_1BG0054310 [Eleusine coracana subsp. coracana]GJN37802.1 hypothetical protein PR202_gb26791 [Eleusine coracana subsp. coracana]
MSPPFLPDDVVREILLRLPWHDDPSCLVRATLVCKHWRGLVTDPGFLRRVRPPVFGVFLNNPPADAHFVPAAGCVQQPCISSLLRPAPSRGWFVRDSRRGLVLLSNRARFLVWDPATDDQVAVPKPPALCDCFFHGLLADALLRRPTTTDDDDERSSSSSFRVAVALIEDGVAAAAVYSSDTGAWATARPAPAAGLRFLWMEKPGAVVGEAAHWLLSGCRVLKLQHAGGGDQHQQDEAPALSVLEPGNAPAVDDDNVQLMRTHDGALGLIAMTGLALRRWTLATTAREGGMSWWTPCDNSTIRFDESILGPRRGHRRYPGRFRDEKLSLASALALLDCREAPAWGRIVGVDEDGATVFLWRMYSIFMLRLQPTPTTPRVSKICDGYFVLKPRWKAVYPYSCFFLGGNIVT